MKVPGPQPPSHDTILRNISSNRKLYLFEGIVLISTGVLAIVIPTFTVLAINVVIAISLVVAGIGRLLTFRRNTQSAQWKLLGGLVFLLGGLFMLVFPLQGIAAIVFVVAAILLAQGVLDISAAFRWRGYRLSGWIFASGILSLVLAALLLVMFPGAGVFYLAVVIGLGFISSGVSVLMLVWSAKTQSAPDQ